MATFTVSNLQDSGVGSLRAAIEAANAAAGRDEIVFADGVTGTLTLSSALPQSILQSAGGRDSYRVAALSGISQWTALQWGNTAEIAGSFGQGLQGDLPVAGALDALASGLGRFSSWDEAQQGFDAYASEALSELIGTPVSKSGFF